VNVLFVFIKFENLLNYIVLDNHLTTHLMRFMETA